MPYRFWVPGPVDGTKPIARWNRTEMRLPGQVTAPTLLIVGSADYGVIELNQQAYALLQCEKKLALISGATHLFEEPGTLEQAARSAADWFAARL